MLYACCTRMIYWQLHTAETYNTHLQYATTVHAWYTDSTNTVHTQFMQTDPQSHSPMHRQPVGVQLLGCLVWWWVHVVSQCTTLPWHGFRFTLFDTHCGRRGVVKCKQYGTSYLVLKDVRLRCTFSPEDRREGRCRVHEWR